MLKSKRKEIKITLFLYLEMIAVKILVYFPLVSIQLYIFNFIMYFFIITYLLTKVYI